jgi:lipoprotein-anchoring transpeptidase ErfK/SrfK
MKGRAVVAIGVDAGGAGRDNSPAGASLELTQDTAALYTGTEARTISFPARTRLLAVALVGSARFTVAGRFGAYQKQGDQRAEYGQRSAGIKRRPEALN